MPTVMYAASTIRQSQRLSLHTAHTYTRALHTDIQHTQHAYTSPTKPPGVRCQALHVPFHATAFSDSIQLIFPSLILSLFFFSLFFLREQKNRDTQNEAHNIRTGTDTGLFFFLSMDISSVFCGYIFVGFGIKMIMLFAWSMGLAMMFTLIHGVGGVKRLVFWCFLMGVWVCRSWELGVCR